MAILKIRVIDASGAALAGQTVKVSDAGALQTNADGLAQFLIESDVALAIEINDSQAWSGNSSQLARQEQFQSAGAGFTRLGA